MAGLDGKVALVTGGGKGVGQAMALALAARGVRVVVFGREERPLGETVGEIVHGGGRARHVVGDVRDAARLGAGVARAIDVFGGLDLVVAAAAQGEGGGGGAERGGIELGFTLERAEEILTTNLLGTYGTFHAALPRMNDGGRLVALSSVLGKFGVAGHAATCASHAGLLGLVRATALEVAPRRITCNAIVAGATGLGDPDRDSAEAVELLLLACSPAGDGITGQALARCGEATAIVG